MVSEGEFPAGAAAGGVVTRAVRLKPYPSQTFIRSLLFGFMQIKMLD